MRNSSYIQGVAYLLLAAALWSSGGLLIRWVEASAYTVSFWRSLIAAGTLLLLGRPRWRGDTTQIGGMIFYALTVVLFVIATKWAGAANAIFLQFSAPAYVAIFGPWFLPNEKLSKGDVLATVGVLSGLSLFFVGDLKLEALHGNIAGLLSGVSYGWFLLFMRKGGGKSARSTIIYGNFLATLLVLPWVSWEPLSPVSWGCLILLGVFQLGVAYSFYARAVSKVRAIDTTVILALEPVLNPLWVWIFLSEAPGIWVIVGGGVVLLSALMRGVTRALAESRLSPVQAS